MANEDVEANFVGEFLTGMIILCGCTYLCITLLIAICAWLQGGFNASWKILISLYCCCCNCHPDEENEEGATREVSGEDLRRQLRALSDLKDFGISVTERRRFSFSEHPQNIYNKFTKNQRDRVVDYILQSEFTHTECILRSNQNCHSKCQTEENTIEQKDENDGTEESLVCSICLQTPQDNKNENQYSITKACSHSFHTDCISSWLQRRLDCPICRKPFLQYFSSDIAEVL